MREVEDPHRFGIVVTEGNQIIKLIEKPEDPPSNLAMIGMYYVKDGQGLMKRIEHAMEEDRTVKGEFFLPDPLQKMIDDNYSFNPVRVTDWYDCGTVETLLKTNRVLLGKGQSSTLDEYDCSVIIPPVCIEDGVHVSRSIIGPYVSISSGSHIQDSIIRNSIINEKSTVEDVLIQNSLIGENTVIKGTYKCLNIGDFSTIHYE